MSRKTTAKKTTFGADLIAGMKLVLALLLDGHREGTGRCAPRVGERMISQHRVAGRAI